MEQFSQQILKQGTYLETVIADYGISGEGVAKVGGYVVFVPQAMVGEKVRIRVEFVKKNFAKAVLVEVLTKSPFRVAPPCNRYGRCGGCNMLHIDYAEQLRIKKLSLKNTLKKNAHLDIDVADVVPSPSPFGYRNKLQLPFGEVRDQNGTRVVLGFFEEGTHKVVPIGKCFLNGDWAEKLISVVLAWASTNRLAVYDGRTGKGLLRHLVARQVGDTVSVTIVAASDKLPNAKELFDALRNTFATVALYLSPNFKHDNVIMGDTVKFLCGIPQTAEMVGVKYGLNPMSFLQVNTAIATLLYRAAIDAIKPDKDTVFIDAYAGIGVLGAAIAKFGARVYNIEIVPEAVADGIATYKNNGVECSFVCGDAATELPALAAREVLPNKIAVLIDPPRKGCAPEVLTAINDLAESHDVTLVYISCNPATLSRDIALLTSYEVKSVAPYDMFCHTDNLETLCILVKKQ